MKQVILVVFVLAGMGWIVGCASPDPNPPVPIIEERNAQPPDPDDQPAAPDSNAPESRGPDSNLDAPPD